MFVIKKPVGSANVGRTIRFTDELFEEPSNVARRNGVSFNMLVLQCCRYALDNLEEDDNK